MTPTLLAFQEFTTRAKTAATGAWKDVSCQFDQFEGDLCAAEAYRLIPLAAEPNRLATSNRLACGIM
jgi:hypothetical protein